MRAAADTRAGEDQHVVEVLDPLDAVQLRRREPQEVRQVPLRLRDVLVLPAPAGFHDADPVALLRGTQRGDAAAEPRADDHHVVVEARHQRSLRGRCDSQQRSRLGCVVAPVRTLVRAGPTPGVRGRARASLGGRPCAAPPSVGVTMSPGAGSTWSACRVTRGAARGTRPDWCPHWGDRRDPRGTVAACPLGRKQRSRP